MLYGSDNFYDQKFVISPERTQKRHSFDSFIKRVKRRDYEVHKYLNRLSRQGGSFQPRKKC